MCSPDGKLVVTANNEDSIVRFWDLAGGKEVGRFRCPGNRLHYYMAFSPDGQVLAVSAGYDRAARRCAKGYEQTKIEGNGFSYNIRVAARKHFMLIPICQAV